MRDKIVRSLLFTPADNPDRMRKAADTEADACIFDLEDAVPAKRQEEARNNLRQITKEVDFGEKLVYTRIEATDTEYWLDDLQAAADANVDGIAIPKVESTYDVALITETIKQIMDEPPRVKLGLETPRGVFYGRDIAVFCKDIPFVTGIGFGSADYSRAIRSPEINDRIKDWMSHLFIGYAELGNMDAWAAGTLDINDLERLRILLEKQREMGFVTSSCIHPKQIGIINDVFTPSKEEYDQAKKLVEEYDNYAGDSLVVDGIFLDDATVDRYRAIADRYERVS